MNLGDSPLPNKSERMETITHRDGKTLCIIVRAVPAPDDTEFYTAEDSNLQVGKIVYSAGGEIARHVHRPIKRQVIGTSEVLIVQKGRVLLDLYTDDQTLLCSREVGAGDIVILSGGGHGFRLLEDAVLIEVKQGPYLGVRDKELF